MKSLTNIAQVTELRPIQSGLIVEFGNLYKCLAQTPISLMQAKIGNQNKDSD